MWWKIALWVVLVLFAILFLFMVRSILLPFIVAFLVAALLDPTIRRLRRRGLSRASAVSIVFFAFFGAVTLIGIVTAPLIGAQIGNFRDGLQRVSQQLAEERPEDSVFLRWNPRIRYESVGRESPIDTMLSQNSTLLERFGLPSTRRALVEQYVEPHRQNIAGYVQGFFNSFLGILTSLASQILFLILTPLLVWMLLMDLERMKVRSMTWIPPSMRAETVSLIRDLGQVVVNYLRGVAVNILIYSTLAAILLWFLGAPYPILLALLYGALYMIPYIGAFISYGSLIVITGLSGQTGNFFMSFSSSWVFAAVITLIFMVVSEAYDKVMMPRVVGQSVGLHPIVGMFVALAGGALFGLIGMLIAYPAAGAIKVILERLMRVTSSVDSEVLRLPATPLRHRTAAEV